MKKNLFILFVLFISTFSFNANAQHASFKGISLGEDGKTFIAKMKEKGFVLREKETSLSTMNVYEFVGNFVNRSDCDIWVCVTKDDRYVIKVIVYLPKESDWYRIKNDYNNLVDAYTEKYGDPNDNFHFFSSPYYEGDGFEMSALRNGKCTYAAYWIINENYIVVEMSDTERIKIIYEDKENTDIFKDIKTNGIQNDI